MQASDSGKESGTEAGGEGRQRAASTPHHSGLKCSLEQPGPPELHNGTPNGQSEKRVHARQVAHRGRGPPRALSLRRRGPQPLAVTSAPARGNGRPCPGLLPGLEAFRSGVLSSPHPPAAASTPALHCEGSTSKMIPVSTRSRGDRPAARVGARPVLAPTLQRIRGAGPFPCGDPRC